MNCIGSMLPIWPSPTTLIVLYHMDALAFIADISGFYGYFKGETVVIWPAMLLVPYQSIYHFGNFHKRRGFQSVAARFGPPATLQRDMKARVPPATTFASLSSCQFAERNEQIQTLFAGHY